MRPPAINAGALARLHELSPETSEVRPWYSDDRAEIKEYLLSISDMKKRRSEALRIYAIREARRKAYQSRLRQSDATYRRYARKSRIASGIPARKHAASRAAGLRALYPLRPR